jgi:hypothetical protein
MGSSVRAGYGYRACAATVSIELMIKDIVRDSVLSYLRGRGYDIHVPTPSQRANKRRFYESEHRARLRFDELSPEARIARSVALENKYARQAAFGKMRLAEAIRMLSVVINPLEPELGCVSQLTHELQLAGAMESDGMDESLVFSALVHDLGTLLLLTDEDPINVEAGGKKAPLAGTPGCGLHNCTFRWDHGDFVYLRLKEHVPADIGWLLRNHSMDLDACEPYMDAQDREYTQRLFEPFERYDSQKDMYQLPKWPLEHYEPLLDRFVPHEILV